eukprot:c36501_g1_i1 orf=367-1116(+)
MVKRLSSMAVLPSEMDYGVLGADLILNMCIKVLAETLAAAPALCFTILPRLMLADPFITDEQARFPHGDMGICDSSAAGCCFAEPCLASELASTMIDSTVSEEHNPSTCKVHDEIVEGPDTSSRLRSKEINAWLAVAKNKDDDDDDDDEEDEDDEEDDDEDAADEEDVADDGEGEEGVAGQGEGAAGDDEDDDDDDDDDENGKGDDEEEDEDGVEGEDDEDEDGVEDEEDDDEEDDDDETPEPPQKKRK